MRLRIRILLRLLLLMLPLEKKGQILVRDAYGGAVGGRRGSGSGRVGVVTCIVEPLPVVLPFHIFMAHAMKNVVKRVARGGTNGF